MTDKPLTDEELTEMEARYRIAWSEDDAGAAVDIRALIAEVRRLNKRVAAYEKNERARWGNAREVLGLDARGEEGS